MSIFEGVTGLFEGVFDCLVTLHFPAAADMQVRGIFREEPGAITDLDGNDTFVTSPVLKLRAEYAAHLQRGCRLSIATKSGVTYVVTAVYPTRSPADDRHYLALLAEEGVA